jgi:hypothetical protein
MDHEVRPKYILKLVRCNGHFYLMCIGVCFEFNWRMLDPALLEA